MNMKGPTVIWSGSFNVNNEGLNKNVEKKKQNDKNVQFTKPFEFKGSRTLTRTLIVHFCFSIWHSRTFKCWFQRNSFMNVCTVWKTSEKTRSSSCTPKAAGLRSELLGGH